MIFHHFFSGQKYIIINVKVKRVRGKHSSFIFFFAKVLMQRERVRHEAALGG